jgi:hypothetical protein
MRAEAIQEHRMALEDVCTALMRAGTLEPAVSALLWSRAGVLGAAPLWGAGDSHAVRDLTFPPLFVIAPREAASSGPETRRGQRQCTPLRARCRACFKHLCVLGARIG